LKTLGAATGSEMSKCKGAVTYEKAWGLNIVQKVKAKNIPAFMKVTLFDVVIEENMFQELPKGFR